MNPTPAVPLRRQGSPARAGTPGPLRRWVLGARPRTLPAAVVPVLVGTAAAHSAAPQLARAPVVVVSSAIWLSPWWRALGALVVALAIQVGTNYANDYSDGIRGTDEGRVGPLRLVASGLAAPRTVRAAALASFAVAGIAGLVLAAATSWWIVAVGAACLAAGWLYTGGPRPYGYAGLGEVFVFVFFGIVATVGTYYVQGGSLGNAVVLVAACAVGTLATALLVANNVRDIDTDRRAGKRTLAVRLGRRDAGWLYVACVAAPFVLVAGWALASLLVGGTLRTTAVPFLPLVALVLAVKPVRTVLSGVEGRGLLPVLAATGQLQLVFGLLLAAGLLVWTG